MQFDITISSDRPVDDLISLSQWLRRERELAGSVTQVRHHPAEEELGGAIDAISVALGSGGAISAFVATLRVWLQNRPKTKIKIARGKYIIEVDTGRVKDLSSLLAQLNEINSGPSK